MKEVIKYTNASGEVNYGLVLSWLDGKREMAEVFFDSFRHPAIPPLKVIYQCTVPHEREPEIVFFPIKKQVDGTRSEVLPARYANVKWICPDISRLEASQDMASILRSPEMMKYRISNAARFVEKEFAKHASAAREAAKEEVS